MQLVSNIQKGGGGGGCGTEKIILIETNCDVNTKLEKTQGDYETAKYTNGQKKGYTEYMSTYS